MGEIIPPRGFPRIEFERRLEKAQSKMAAQNIDLLLLTTEPELRYFSGFLTQFWQSPTRPWFMIVPASGKPVAIIPEIGATLMARTWLDDIRTWGSPNPTDDGISLLAAAIKEFCDSTAIIGTVMGLETHLRMPLAGFQELNANLGGRHFVDATPLIKCLRMQKSSLEIDKISYICDVASKSFAQADQLFSEGQPLRQVFREFKIACLNNGADDVPYLVGAADQGGYSDVISPPSDAPLKSGDVLMLDTGATFDGYFCDFDRNVAIDKASDSAKNLYDTLWLATEAGLNAARPGVTCADLYRAMQTVIVDRGGITSGVGRFGHGLGMQLTEWPSHMPADETVLVEGMVLTLEPSMSFDGDKMMVHEENIVIRDGAAELLSKRAARDLPVIGA